MAQRHRSNAIKGCNAIWGLRVYWAALNVCSQIITVSIDTIVRE